MINSLTEKIFLTDLITTRRALRVLYRLSIRLRIIHRVHGTHTSSLKGRLPSCKISMKMRIIQMTKLQKAPDNH